MGRRIALIQGHPDPSGGHLDHALAAEYARAATEAGHEVRPIEVARLDWPLLRSQKDWEAAPPEAIRGAQEIVSWADHLVFVFPLWLGDMPALLKGFLEQLLRPGFAFGEGLRDKRLRGKSARVIVTMGMPALFYRGFFMAHSVKSLKRNVLQFCGVRPVRFTLIGLAGTRRAGEKAVTRAAALGRRAG